MLDEIARMVLVAVSAEIAALLVHALDVETLLSASIVVGQSGAWMLM